MRGLQSFRMGLRSAFVLMHEQAPVVEPYFLIEDVAAAVEAAKSKGADIAVPPMEFLEKYHAIYIQVESIMVYGNAHERCVCS